jgi:hypothetical protein
LVVESTKNGANDKAAVGDYRPQSRASLSNAQMRFAKNNDMVEALTSVEPINLSAYPFCQGERAEIGRSRVPMARTRRMKSLP